MEAALIWGLGFLGLGLLMVVIDMFVPTFGVLSLVAAGCGITGVVILFNHSVTWGLVGAACVLVGGPAAFFFGLQIMPKTPLGRRLVLGAMDDDGEDRPPPVEADPYKAMVGQEGVVVTDLRPVGVIRIGEERLDALSETTVIRSGSKVKVVGVVDGRLLKVRPVA